MTDQRLIKAMALAGAVAAVLYIVGFIVLGGNSPSDDETAAKVVSYYHDHRVEHHIAIVLVSIAAVLLPFFGASLRTALNNGGTASKALSNVAFAGALVTSAGFFGAVAIHFSLLAAVENKQTDVALALNVLDNDDFFFLLGGVSIVTLATGLASVGSAGLPKWVGWLSIVLAVAALARPLGLADFFLFPIWLIIVSVILFRRLGSGPAPTSTT